MELKNKVAIYTRVSTIHQIDKESLIVQKKELANYSEYILGIKDVEIFEDAGYSGKDTDRPAFQEMMERMESGEFSHLLVWKIDRISRNLLDFSEMYKKLKGIGVTFISKNEQFDTSTAIGEAMLKIILVFAELERKMASERVTSVMMSRASDGKWNGGPIHYGYSFDKETKTFSIKEDEAVIVKRMYHLYERTLSISAVARILNEENIYNKYGKPWTGHSVHRILTNRFYVGMYVYNRHEQSSTLKPESEWLYVENHHPAIISKEVQDQTIKVLHSRQKGRPHYYNTRVTKHIHIFAGLIVCAKCGHNFNSCGDKVRSCGIRPSYYRCRRTSTYGGPCQNKYVNDIHIGPFVFNYISNLIKLSSKFFDSMFDDEIFDALVSHTCFQQVSALTPDTYKSIRKMMSQKNEEDEFNPFWLFNGSSSRDEDAERIKTQLIKDQTALTRLNQLFLYGDTEMPKSDYLQQYNKLLQRIDEKKNKLSSLNDETLQSALNNPSVLSKASYILLIQEFSKDEYFDYINYVVSSDPLVPQHFLRSIISSISVLEGKIVSITFKNGEKHEFIY